MTDDYLERIDELYEAAWDPMSIVSLNALREAVRIADEHHDEDAGRFLRNEFIRVAVHTGAAQEALVALSWLLGQYDRNPELAGEAQDALRSNYLLVSQTVPNFPEISLQQINDILDDMADRREKFGQSRTYAEMARLVVALMIADRTRARECWEAWQDCHRRQPQFCDICRTDLQMWYDVFFEDYKAAVRRGVELLKDDPGCTCPVPLFPYCRILYPLMKLNRWEEAEGYHQRSWQRTLNSVGQLGCVAEQLEYAALTNSFRKCITMLEKQFHGMLTTQEHCDRFDALLACRLLFLKLKQQGRDEIRLRLPQDFALYNDSGSYNVDQLSTWFFDEVSTLGTRFDARNENDHYSRLVAENEAKIDTLVRPEG